MSPEGLPEEDIRAVICALEACGYLDLNFFNEDMLVDEIMDHLEHFPNGVVPIE